MKNELIENIDKVHTTEMGVDRIRRNLALGAKVMEGKRFSSSVSAEKLGEWAKEFIV